MERKQALIAWTQEILNDSECYIKPASNDASFRSYWRVFSRGTTYIVMDAPTEHEDCKPFIDISKRLVKSGINAAKVLKQELTQGFLLLNDLGAVQYLSVLNKHSSQELYLDALNSLHDMQEKTAQNNLPIYDMTLLKQELELFTDWFIKKHLAIALNTSQKTIIQNCQHLLITNALEQPQTFVHRDYHSRNLMKTKTNNPGVLDFQDAVIGPATYDLVSLLRDCYIAWDNQFVCQLSDEFRQKFNHLNNSSISAGQWQRWFDLMGIQRHMKAVGIFCRLNYRDKKPGYLKDINLTLCYIKTIGANYPELKDFIQLIDSISPTMESLCEQ